MPFDAPEYMQSNAARGLKYLDEGFGGDGLTDGTKREAREMAAGNISDNKVRKMAPWFARHKVDGQAPKNSNPSDAQYPGAGLVAWLLWGGDSNFSDRAQNWAQSKIDALDAEANPRSKVKKIERRTFTVQDVEARQAADGTMRLSGYAAVFNDASVPLPFKETIAPGAFRKTLSETPDVRLLINHEGLPLARTKNGTLTLSEDSRGLLIDAEIADTTEGRDLWTLVERGDVDQMSFAFRVIRQSWNKDRTERTLTEVSLADGDVSVVTYPAYPTTMVEARDAVKKLRFTSDQSSEDMARYAESYDKARSGIAELISLEAQEMADGSDETDSITHLLAAASHLLEWYSGEVEEEGITLPGAETPEAEMPMADPMAESITSPMSQYAAPKQMSLRLAKAKINNTK